MENAALMLHDTKIHTTDVSDFGRTGTATRLQARRYVVQIQAGATLFFSEKSRPFLDPTQTHIQQVHEGTLIPVACKRDGQHFRPE
jgi:hypothetical protein